VTVAVKSDEGILGLTWMTDTRDKNWPVFFHQVRGCCVLAPCNQRNVHQAASSLLSEFQIGVLFPFDPALGEDDERSSLNMAPYVSEVREDVRRPLDAVMYSYSS